MVISRLSCFAAIILRDTLALSRLPPLHHPPLIVETRNNRMSSQTIAREFCTFNEDDPGFWCGPLLPSTGYGVINSSEMAVLVA